ncbi:MAG TPA: hypothetical protein VFD10_08380 [Atribacterota bacterium]|nr:hypothetical protein [Atribacterota bacterium]
MKRKRFKIITLTLTLLLLCSTAAYAYTLSGSSSIGTSLSTVYGYSITRTDAVCDSVYAEGWLYRNGTLADNNWQTASGSSYAQAYCSTINLPLLQNWELTGYHKSTIAGVEKTSSSNDSRTY